MQQTALKADTVTKPRNARNEGTELAPRSCARGSISGRAGRSAGDSPNAACFCVGSVENTLQARRKQIPALKARNSKARGETPGLDRRGTSPARAAQQLCRPCRHARQAKHPSAESASQHSPGRKPWEWHEIKPALKGRHRFSQEKACAALSGLISPLFRTQGSRARCRALFHPGLCCAAPSALHLLTLA
jgi:hypothetical protein